MKCPHCLENFHEDIIGENIGADSEGYWRANYCLCPACKKGVIFLNQSNSGRIIKTFMAYPKGISRSPVPTEVDDTSLVADYLESCLVLSDSPKASAALSRRCLQHILREKASVKNGNLSDEIQEVIDSGKMPSDLADNLDYVRWVGNFAAHPNKSISSGMVVDVELGEAEWNLDVVEELIDFYYVRPARTKKKRDELNAKLKDAGKKEI